MADSLFIQIRFKTKRSGYPELSDALFIPKDEYEAMKPEQIEALKEERVQAFCDRIDNPPVIVEPTKAEKLAAIDSQLTELLSQKGQLEGKEYQVAEKVVKVVVEGVK